MAKYKVLHIIKSLGRGGAETLLPETLRLHNRDEFEFHYMYFLPWKDQMVGSIQQHGGTVVCLNASNNIKLILKTGEAAAYVRKHKIQLIHAHLPWAGILARRVGRMTGVPVLYTEHNKQERYHFATRLMNLATMNWLTRVIAVSADVAESIQRHKPGLKIPVQTILNGVNTEHFSREGFNGAATRESLGIPADAFVIGTIAVFRFQKRLDVWLELARQIREKNPLAHFIIVGDGPLKQMLHDKQKALGMEGYVHFVGLQTEVRPYLAAFDLYMMCSIFEGLPIALLEAMAFSTPVITTDAGGIKEVIRHEQDGLLCSVDEPGRLVGFATQLHADTAQRKRLAQQGRKRIEEVFSMDQMVRALEHTYVEEIKQAGA